jgi:hypothetical protein
MLRYSMAGLSGLLIVISGVPVAQAVDRGPVSAPAAVSASARSLDSVTRVSLGQWECPSGHICFWNARDGQGERCAWDVADPDWASGSVRCSWALTTNVQSVYNNGTSSDGSTGVTYYRQGNFSGRIGCTRNGQRGNLAGTYKIRSHKWTRGACGR